MEKRIEKWRKSIKYPLACKPSETVDMIEVILKPPGNDGEYVKWINQFLELLIDRETEQIIGFNILGLKKILTMVEEGKKEEFPPDIKEAIYKDFEQAGWKIKGKNND